MIARIRRPGPPLGEYVDRFWCYHGYAAAHRRERALPTGTVELVLNLREEPIRIFKHDADLEGRQFGGAVVCGAHSGYFVLEPSQQNRVIGIHFRPGGATPFVGVPAGEMTDRHVELGDVWGSRARGLRERLLDAGDPEAMFDLLERELLQRLRRPLLPNPAVVWAVLELTARPGVVRIDDIREETGYSSKHFIQMFRHSVGLTPKVYSRVQRFQSVLRSLVLGRKVDWADVAIDGGYCDQSHLNREFRAFAGVTPGDYRPVSDDRRSHVPIQE